MKTSKYIGTTFESSTVKTKQFKAFSRAFNSDIKEVTKNDFDIVDWNVGHFDISGFLKFKLNSRLVYFSISDVRHFKDAWHKNILIRTAEHEKDFSGGGNNYATLENFNDRACMLVL
jgi:hypothetical protein